MSSFSLLYFTLATRFVLKLTDFGLHELRQKSDVETERGSYEQLKARLWTAPELLRQQVPPFYLPTPLLLHPVISPPTYLLKAALNFPGMMIKVQFYLTLSPDCC